MKNTNARRWTVLSAALCVLLVLNAVVAYRHITGLRTSEAWVLRSHDARRALSELQHALAVSQAASRGYALTGDAHFLAEHVQAARDVQAALVSLRQLTRENPAQQTQLDRVEQAARKVLAWSSQLIKGRSDSGLEGAQRLVATGTGITLAAAFHASVAAMDSREAALLSARNESAGAQLRETLDYLIGYTVISVLFAMLLTRMARRQAARRIASENALSNANRMLHAVLDTIPGRVFWKDRDSRYLGGNRLFAQDAGVEHPEQLVGRTDTGTNFAPHADKYRDDDLAVMEGGAPRFRYEEPFRRADGSPGWLETSKVPLRDEDGAVIGVLGTYHDITERKEAEATLLRLTHFDALTGLPNVDLITDRLAQETARARRLDAPLAVAIVNLDEFKLACDAHGRAVGDRILVETAKRLRAAVRTDDTVGRYGADEFVLLLSSRGEEGFLTALERVVEELARPFAIDGVKQFMTCSIGASTFPHDGADGATLLANASTAMYRAKQMGRNRIEVFEPEMGRRLRERVAIERDLRTALESDQFELHYQPQLDLRSGAVRGVEALVRWRHPEHGMMSPARFIPVAEQSGLIVPLGASVLSTACAQAKQWQDAGLGPLRVSVNLSALQLRQPGFADMVAATLERSGLAPEHLELEVTESLLMSGTGEAVDVLEALAATGICVSVDDFGTGYSSLSYLKRLPVGKLKIDQSFVRDVPGDANDVAITRAVVALGRSLDLRVVAEGVETAEQCELMRALDCDEIQGYWFSRPLEAEAVAQFLGNRRG